jgi:LysM repeat protein
MGYYRLSRWVGALFVALALTACTLGAQQEALPAENQLQSIAEQTNTATPDRALEIALLQTGEPLPSVTPFATLRPPPTDEPPTPTPTPTVQPSETPIPTIEANLDELGLLGLNTETPLPGEATPCAPNPDWELRYEVRPGDALGNIAPRYNSTVEMLAEGNCIEDPTLIRVGQVLRVPGSAHPLTPEFICTPWELLAPYNGTITVPGAGQLGFAWNGPESPRSLLRIYTQNADNSLNQVYEQQIELVQTASVDLSEIPAGGLYFWRIFPLGNDFRQIPCVESYTAQFVKAPAPTEIPNVAPPGQP